MSWNSDWKGKRVRNADGREGVISKARVCSLWVELKIACNDGSTAGVTLWASGPDGGDAGWQWLCENFDGGSAWLPLGDKGAPMLRVQHQA